MVLEGPESQIRMATQPVSAPTVSGVIATQTLMAMSVDKHQMALVVLGSQTPTATQLESRPMGLAVLGSQIPTAM